MRLDIENLKQTRGNVHFKLCAQFLFNRQAYEISGGPGLTISEEPTDRISLAKRQILAMALVMTPHKCSKSFSGTVFRPIRIFLSFRVIASTASLAFRRVEMFIGIAIILAGFESRAHLSVFRR